MTRTNFRCWLALTEPAEYLRQYIAEREDARAAYEARRRQAEEDKIEFTEPWQFDGDDNDTQFEGAFAEDMDIERDMYDD